MCIDCEYADDMPDPTRDYRYILKDIELAEVETGIAFPAVFEWDEVDPWAVTINFGPKSWTFGRELLKAGLHYDAGLGDVQFKGDVLHPNRRLMILDSPDGRIVLRFDPIEVAFFVESIDRHLGRTVAHPTNGGDHA
jgi:hypothetical protein